MSGEQSTGTRRFTTLRELRKAAGMTQLQVAFRLGVSLSTVTNIETGRQQPRVDLARKVADLFNVPLDVLDWPRRETARRSQHPRR